MRWFALRVNSAECPRRAQCHLDAADRFSVWTVFTLWSLLTIGLILNAVVVPAPVRIVSGSPVAQGWFVYPYLVSILTVPGSLFSLGWRSPRVPWKPFPGLAIAILPPLLLGLVLYVGYQIWPVRMM